MHIKIRDWEKYFERDRSKQWKHLGWLPIPNKQGPGYRKLINENNGLELFGCWIALLEVASLYGNPRGNLTKYTLSDLSRLTLISEKKLEIAIIYFSQSLDWIENIDNLDINANNLDVSSPVSLFDSSILSNSLILNSSRARTIIADKIKSGSNIPPTIEDVKNYCLDRKNNINPNKFFDFYESKGWVAGHTKMKNWQAAIRNWEHRNKENNPQFTEKKLFQNFELPKDY